MSIDLPRRFAIARWQKDGWDEPCKSRGLRTVLWAAGGEIPPADPAADMIRAVRPMVLDASPQLHSEDANITKPVCV
jgi:hypothetical protein